MKTIIFKACLAILLLTMLTSDGNSQLRNQIFIGARPLGLGETFVAIADDGNASYWNPAGLPTLRGLVFNSMYANLYNIHGLRTIYLSQAVPFKQRFAVGANWFYFGYSDDEFDYSQHKFNLSLGARIYNNIFLGANLKYLNTGAKLDEISYGKANGFGFDLGALYSLPLENIKFLKGIKLGMMIHDITGTSVKYSETKNSETILTQNIRYGVAFYFKEKISLKWFSLKDALLAFDIDDRLHIGTEAWLLDLLGIRAGLQKDIHTDEGLTYSFGIGIKFKNIQLDHAYVIPPTLPSSNITSLSFTQSISPLNIADIRVNDLKNVYASFYKSYATVPGFIEVAVRNDYDQALKGTMNVSIPGLLESAIDTTFELLPDHLDHLQFPANFSEDILDVREEDQQVAISIEYKIENVKKSAKTSKNFRLLGRGALTWEEPRKAVAFMTKDDNMVKYFVRDISYKIPYRPKDELGYFYRAAALFEAMRDIGIEYREDPETPFSKISKDQQTVDHILYPAELLTSKQGDCDDLTVLYASLLECSGIRTALVSAKDFITLMFNTEVQQEDQRLLPFGDSLFVIRNRSIWIPIDVKEIGTSFLKAWQIGGKKYRELESDEDIKVISVSEAEKIYPSALPAELQDQVPDLPKDEFLTEIADTLARLQRQRINIEKGDYLKELELKPTNSSLLNKYGNMLVKQDSLDKAKSQFEKIRANEPINPQALVNLGNIHFISGELINAGDNYLRAVRYTENKAGLYLNLSILNQYLKSESPTDSIRIQSESEKYLTNVFQLLEDDETEALDLLQISIEEIEYKDITEFQSEAKRLVAAVRKFIQDGAKTVKDVRLDTRIIKKGMDKNRRYILWWAD